MLGLVGLFLGIATVAVIICSVLGTLDLTLLRLPYLFVAMFGWTASSVPRFAGMTARLLLPGRPIPTMNMQGMQACQQQQRQLPGWSTPGHPATFTVLSPGQVTCNNKNSSRGGC